MPKERKQSANDILAEIALEERKEKLEEKKSKERARKIALDQHYAQVKEDENKWARIQKICDHLLGNHRIGVIPSRRFCALHMHTLSNKSTYIRCGKCRAVWQPGDTAEFFLRKDGQGPIKLPNPTNTSYRDIRKFLFTFENANDLHTIAFRIERVEPEDLEEEVPVAV